MAEPTAQLCLSQKEYAFLQDATKGTVAVYAGPYSFSLSGNDRPVIYDKEKDTFVYVDVQKAISQNAFVPEGHYLVLENPSVNDKGDLVAPSQGSNGQAKLQTGRKIVIPGPSVFPLWPGQFAESIPGHHLRSNQYLIVRVYNAEEATKNAPAFLKSTIEGDTFTPGQLIVIKGTQSSFFIPPTGFEVLQDGGEYVREALTLERLEYCILLDEDGNKRFEKGPQVVFPEATEHFVLKDNARKLKAIELNDQTGVYVKVTADYDTEGSVKAPAGTHNIAATTKDGDEFFHNGAKYRVEGGKVFALAGEELFITGKVQRFYYPRAEHALIGYDDPTRNFKRERYYGITIPKGEGRYVLDKREGRIKLVQGPQIFLPDPRNEVIVRRVLDDKTVNLWFPASVDALSFNRSLRESLEDTDSNYLAVSPAALAATADLGRSVNRGTTKSKSFSEPVPSSYGGDALSRGTKFTPPPTLTLNSKYDGIPSISVWTGYAVQVVDKSGNRRVEIGPTSFLLGYDETLEIIELSTGKPKTTDTLKRDVYLRVDNNLVSDIVRIETKDLVNMDLKVSYRVNFLREHKDNWFSVENYVKYLCDHQRSLLKAALKKKSVTEVIENSADLIRDVVLGIKEGDKARKRFFPENGMEVYDVEVLSVTIADPKISNLLIAAQTKAVETAITLTADEQNLVSTKRRTLILTEIAELEQTLELRKLELTKEFNKVDAETKLAEIASDIEKKVRLLEASVEEQVGQSQIAEALLTRRKNESLHELELEKERTALFEKKMSAISPNLIQALQTLGDNEVTSKLAVALAPLALTEQQGIGATIERVVKGTPLETVLNNMKTRSTTAGK